MTEANTLRWAMPLWCHSGADDNWSIASSTITREDYEIFELLRSRRRPSSAYDGYWAEHDGVRPFDIYAEDDYSSYTSGVAPLPWGLLDVVFVEGWEFDGPQRAGRWLVYRDGAMINAVCLSADDVNAYDGWTKPKPADVFDVVVDAYRVFYTLMECAAKYNWDEKFDLYYRKYLEKVFTTFPKTDVLAALAGQLVENDEDSLLVEVIKTFKADMEE